MQGSLEARCFDLKQKLATWHYFEDFGIDSLPLVERLLSDIVITTESYRALQHKSDETEEALQEANRELDPIRRELKDRLKENNQLHLEMIRQAEEIDERERQWTTEMTKLRGQVADLTFKTTHQEAKARAQMQEHSHMKAQLDKVSAALRNAKPIKDDKGNKRYLNLDQRMEIPRFASHREPQPQDDDPTALSQKQTATMAAKLHEEVANLNSENDSLKTENRHLVAAVASREKEVARMVKAVSEVGTGGGDEELRAIMASNRAGIGAGTLEERLEADRANDSHALRVEQLNEQIDLLNSQLAQQEQQTRAAIETVAALQREQARGASAVQAADAVQDANQALKGDLATATLEMGRLAKELRIAREELAMRGNAARDGDDEDVRAERDSLKVENARMAEVLSSYQDDKQSMSQELQRLNRALAEEGQGRVAAQDTALDAKEAMAANTEKMRKMEDQSAKVMRDLQLHQEIVAELQAKQRQHDKNREQQHLELTSMERLLAQYTSDASLLSRQLQQKESELRVAGERMEALEVGAQRMRGEMGEAGAGHERAQRLVQAAIDERDHLRRQLQELNATREGEAMDMAKAKAVAESAEADLKRMQGRVEVLQREGAALEAELSTARQGARQAQSQLQRLAQLEGTALRVRELEGQLAAAKEHARQAEEAKEAAEREVQRIHWRLDGVSSDKEGVEGALEAGRRERGELLALLQKERAAGEKTASELRTLEVREGELRRGVQHAEAEAAVAREVVVECRAEVESLSARLQRATAECADWRRRHTQMGRECEGLRERMLQEGEGKLTMAQTAEGERTRREGITRELAQTREEVRALAAERNELLGQAAELRESHVEVRRAKEELEGREKQTAQLRTLFVQLDGTRQRLEGRLEQCRGQLQEQGRHAEELQSELTRQRAAVAAKDGECQQLRTKLCELDRTRDSLQHQLDSLTEQLQAASAMRHMSAATEKERNESLDSVQRRLASMERALSGKEQELSKALALLDEARKEAKTAKELASMREQELGASSYDLQAMARENQAINSQLHNLTNTSKELKRQLDVALARARREEDRARTAKVEKDDLLATYRAVCDEKTMLQAATEEMQSRTEMQARRLREESDEATRLRGEVARVDRQAEEQHAELLAYERQVEHMSHELLTVRRQLQRATEERNTGLTEGEKHKQVAQALVREAQQVQRQVVTARHDAAGLQAQVRRLEGLKVGLEDELSHTQRKLSQLEGLLVDIRAKESSWDMMRAQLMSEIDQAKREIAVLRQESFARASASKAPVPDASVDASVDASQSQADTETANDAAESGGEGNGAEPSEEGDSEDVAEAAEAEVDAVDAEAPTIDAGDDDGDSAGVHAEADSASAGD